MGELFASRSSTPVSAAVFCQSEKCESFSAVKGARCQSAQRSTSAGPATRATRGKWGQRIQAVTSDYNFF